MSPNVRESGANSNAPFEFGKKIGEGSLAEVFESKKDPNFVIKKLGIYHEAFLPQGVFINPKRHYSEEEFRAHHQHSIKYLLEKFPDYLPASQLVFGTDETGDQCGYLVQERIYPDKPSFFNKAELLKKVKTLDGVLARLIDFYLQQYTEEGMVLMPDFVGKKEKDLMYGHTNKNSEPRFYLPDIYPLVSMHSMDELLRSIGDKIKKYSFYDFPETHAAEQRLKSQR